MDIKSWFTQTVREGNIIPSHVGIAYRDPLRNEAVCYLIPFNWVVRIARHIWIRIRIPTWNSFEKQYGTEIYRIRLEVATDMHRRGFIDGYVTHALNMRIPAKYEKSVSDTILRIQNQFMRGLRKEDVPPAS